MSAPTITPTAIDAFVHIESVWVTDRHRRDLGDLQELADSIDDVGLLNPITLTRAARLVAGQRRLEACRLLGWVEVPVRFVDSLDDAAKLLRAERDENTCRKDMLPSEMASLGAALYDIEAEHARERQRDGQERGRATQRGMVEGTRTPNQTPHASKATDAVGEALGMSGRTYQELRYVHEIATDPDAPGEHRELARAALTAMDHGAGVAGEARRLRGKLRAKQEAQDAKTAAMAEPEHEARPRTTKDAEERRARIRELAVQGYTSHQIGEQIGMLPVTVRKNARDHGIEIPADIALGKGHRRIDSNRVVRETVHALEGLAMGIRLVDVDELDPEQVDEWASSLTESIRVVNRLVKAMKEKARE